MTITDFSLLVQNMLQEEFYPHPVKLPIELIQTHISYIFLTGDYAYKLKKPVNLGFLDFSTPAKRHHFTQVEIKLNKPVAPDIYLEVIPITQKDNQYELSGPGELREYVLKMRQFPQQNLLLNLLKRGLVTAESCQELAQVVARFHEKALTNEYIKSFGTRDKIKEAIEENYQNTSQYLDIIQPRQQFQETQAFTEQFCQDKEHLFRERQTQDKIKECHGDLHLKNICVYQDKIQLFDRIEFNEEFRYVDVIYDVAFTVMDFDFNQAQDLGNIFLNNYLEMTGDWEGAQVLRLYLVRQAYVRAKVDSFAVDDSELSESERDQAKLEAQQYYHLAWQYTQTQRGKIILMSGLSGSGKSTVAKELAKKVNAIIIRSDAVRKHLGDVPLDTQGEADLYSQEMTEKTYNRLIELGVKLAKEGYTVILDATYNRHQQRSEAIAQAEAKNIPVEIYYCTAPIEVLKERLYRRQSDVSDATSALLDKQIAKREDFTQAELAYLTTIDTNQNNWQLSIIPEKG